MIPKRNMSRLKLSSIVLIVVLLAAAGGSGEKPVSVDPLTPLSYSLYSAIYRSQTSSERLGIAATPLSFPRDLACLRPSTPEERQMVEGATNQVVGSVQWKREFDFGRAYTLIPAIEVNKAIDCIQFSRRDSAAGCEPYAKLKYVRILSIPVFNKDHTRVLVATSRVCGGLCGNGGVFVYRKTAQGWEWEKNSFAGCHWVS
jgi:hypothetical protein